MKDCCSYGMISRSRKALMGIAAIWIVLYHSEIVFSRGDGFGLSHFLYLLDYYIYLIKSLGFIGVDIFLFLSAVGLYYSMGKDQNLLSFYRRRIKRIVPAYLLVTVVFEFMEKTDLAGIIKLLTGWSFLFTGNRTNWYFILLFFLYLVYPLIYRIYKRYGCSSIVLLIIVDLLFNFFLSKAFPVFFLNTKISLQRIPVFLMGCLFSDKIKNGESFHFSLFFLVLLFWFASFRYIVDDTNFSKYVYDYICSFHGFCFVFTVSFLFVFFGKYPVVGKMQKVCSYFGEYSMEYYLLFERVLYYMKKMRISDHSVLIAIISFVLCHFLSILVKKISEHFQF